jgi:hypothetical protein
VAAGPGISAFCAAAGGLPWVLRERKPLPPSVEASIRLLDEPRRHSAARRSGHPQAAACVATLAPPATGSTASTGTPLLEGHH